MKEPIVILGPGRCGSTLLQRILNTSEEITIWGEHSGFLAKLAESYYVLTEDKDLKQNFYNRKIPLDPSIVIGELSDYSIDISWINPFDIELVKEVYINHITQLLARHIDTKKTCWGFKEIRYTQHDVALKMFLDLFPEARIIFSIRHPFDVIRSMILTWSPFTQLEQNFKNPDSQAARKVVLNYAKRWYEVASSFQYWISQYENLNYHIDRYEDLVLNSQASIKNTFDFLDVSVPDTALKPISIKAGTSPNRNLDYKLNVQQAIYHMHQEIWSLLEDAAKYFSYDLEKVNSFNS